MKTIRGRAISIWITKPRLMLHKIYSGRIAVWVTITGIEKEGSTSGILR